MNTKQTSKNIFMYNFKYQGNYLRWSYNSTETSDVKKGVKTINIEFVWTTFFRPVQAICNLVPKASLFDVNIKK